MSGMAATTVPRSHSLIWKSPPWPSLSLVIDVLLYQRAVLQVLRDNPVKQFRRDLSVPHIVRGHHDHGTSRADKKAITPRLSNGLSTFVETVSLEPAGHQLEEGLLLSVDRAARPRANEEVVPKSL
jgi:hypothetical protein